MLNVFKSQNRIVAEIHNEFDSAQDRLLKEAKEIINREGDISKMACLAESIGFINSPIVKKCKDLSITYEQANLIEYYKQNYPFQKFLTESELDKICRKYNLVYAPVESYIKDIPEKNLIEIDNAPYLKKEDRAEDLKFCKLNYNGIVDLGNIRAKYLGLPFVIKGEHFTGWMYANEYLKKRFPAVSHRTYIVNTVSNVTVYRQGLFIAAPKSHFNKKGLSKSGLGFFTLSIVEVKDPIVFRYCKGGIQVLSKWGLEASDESIVNEKMN